mgnify:FL=1
MSNRVSLRIARCLRSLPAFAGLAVLLAGCGLQSGPKLDATDMKFAAFYSDYLLRSGASGTADSGHGIDMSPAGADSLFARNGIDQERFDAKLRSYSKDPALWREVLLQVRRNLRGQQ